MPMKVKKNSKWLQKTIIIAGAIAGGVIGYISSGSKTVGFAENIFWGVVIGALLAHWVSDLFD